MTSAAVLHTLSKDPKLRPISQSVSSPRKRLSRTARCQRRRRRTRVDLGLNRNVRGEICSDELERDSKGDDVPDKSPSIMIPASTSPKTMSRRGQPPTSSCCCFGFHSDQQPRPRRDYCVRVTTPHTDTHTAQLTAIVLHDVHVDNHFTA